MKTIVIALSATFAFAATAMSTELAYRRPETDMSASTKVVPPASASPSRPVDAEKQAVTSDDSKGRASQATRDESDEDTASDETVTEPKSATPPAGKAKPAEKTAEVKSPANYRTAKWSGGHGATWSTGPNAYGFFGTFGSCKYRGTAGTKGYHIEQSC